MADSGDNVEEHADDVDEKRAASQQQDKQQQHDDDSQDGNDVEAGDAGADMNAKGIRNDDAHLDPSRFWFFSSAFPMIAATLGPVASAFSICALVRPWRQSFPPGSDIDKAVFIDDPIWFVFFFRAEQRARSCRVMRLTPRLG